MHEETGNAAFTTIDSPLPMTTPISINRDSSQTDRAVLGMHRQQRGI
jgi:hypothetical protein